MKYVFDTNVLRQWFKSYFESIFISLWQRFDALVADGTIVSVREVYREIMSFAEQSSLQNWAKTHQDFFREPTDEEIMWVTKIFQTPHFQQMIPRQKLEMGGPVADPFIIAKAKVNNAIVVTLEKAKLNSANIPNVCRALGVECIDLEAFMNHEGWQF